MTLDELKAQVALGTLDVLKILNEEDITELPLDAINALAKLYLIMLKTCPYFYSWIEVETRSHIYNKLLKIKNLDQEIIKSIKFLSPPFFDFRDQL